MSAPTPFHLAFAVTDIDATREFYVNKLGCKMGRSAERWIDFDFFGHQLSLHLGTSIQPTTTGTDGEHNVPMPHYGVILPMAQWRALAAKLEAENTPFLLAPKIRFAGKPGEQATMFFADPSGNALEIKGFNQLQGVFAK